MELRYVGSGWKLDFGSWMYLFFWFVLLPAFSVLCAIDICNCSSSILVYPLPDFADSVTRDKEVGCIVNLEALNQTIPLEGHCRLDLSGEEQE